MRSNDTRPNGDISTNDETQWTWQLAATMDAGSNHTRCAGNDAKCYGRVEVQMGAEAPWGTVCSVGADDEMKNRLPKQNDKRALGSKTENKQTH